MGMSDQAVVIPGQGFLYTAPVGTPRPTNLTDPESPWENLGHSSIDDNVTFARDGGDSNIMGTWQNPALRDRRDAVTFAVTVTLQQIDNNSLGLYFGGGDGSVAGVFTVAANAVPQEKALYIRIIDGDNEVGVYIPKTAIGSDDDVEFDVENFVGFPIRASILNVTGQGLMDWLGEHLGLQGNEVQSVAITGTPTGGSFTLTWNGQTTGTIAYNASAAAVRTALVALSNITAGDVATSGGPLPGTPVVVTFQGQYADADVAQMTADGALLTPSGTVDVTTTTPGGN